MTRQNPRACIEPLITGGDDNAGNKTPGATHGGTFPYRPKAFSLPWGAKRRTCFYGVRRDAFKRKPQNPRITPQKIQDIRSREMLVQAAARLKSAPIAFERHQRKEGSENKTPGMQQGLKGIMCEKLPLPRPDCAQFLAHMRPVAAREDCSAHGRNAHARPYRAAEWNLTFLRQRRGIETRIACCSNVRGTRQKFAARSSSRA